MDSGSARRMETVPSNSPVGNCEGRAEKPEQFSRQLPLGEVCPKCLATEMETLTLLRTERSVSCPDRMVRTISGAV
jgi:hypothetical protein